MNTIATDRFEAYGYGATTDDALRKARRMAEDFIPDLHLWEDTGGRFKMAGWGAPDSKAVYCEIVFERPRLGGQA